MAFMSRKKILPFAVLAAMLVSCSNPTDQESLRWKTRVEIPVTNEAFILAEEMDNLFTDIGNSLRIIGISDTIKGDTVSFGIPDSGRSEFVTTEDSLDEKRYDDVLGPIPLGRAARAGHSIPLPVSGNSLDISAPVPLPGMYHIAFCDSPSNVLAITVTNNSAADLSNLVVGIDGIDSDSVGTVGAGESAAARLDMANQEIDSVVTIGVSCGISGAIAAGDDIGLEFSFEGMKARRVTVIDSLVVYSHVFTNAYRITDTVSVDYVDVLDGYFVYLFTNNTDVRLHVNAHHRNMWRSSYCELQSPPVRTLSDVARLNAPDDSLYAYAGEIIGTDVPARTERGFTKANLSGNRLFTEWDSDSMESVTKVDYHITTAEPRGERITVNEMDSLLFIIRGPGFKFKEFQGTVMEAYDKVGDTQRVKISYPGEESVPDSLRGKMVFYNVFTEISVATHMPEGAAIDTFVMHFSLYDPENESVRSETSSVFVNVHADTTYTSRVVITDVVNLFPDTVLVLVRMSVPVGTRLRVVNDLTTADPDYNKYIGRMTIKADVNYELVADWDWEVLDSAFLDLGGSHFRMPPALRFYRKMDERLALFKALITNNTNVNMRLFALLAPDSSMEVLDSMTTNEFAGYISNSGAAEAAGYVNLLGTSGVYIPGRSGSDNPAQNTVTLDDSQLETVLNADSCAWRWMARFYENPRDVLYDTSTILIQSSMYVEGIQTMDSLLVWEKEE